MTKHFMIIRDIKDKKSNVWGHFKLVARMPDRELKVRIKKRERLKQALSQQVLLATNKSYKPVKFKWITDAGGHVRRVAVPIKIKKWWVENPNGTVHVSVFIKGKPIELEDGKNAIEISGLSELATTLNLIAKSIDLGDFDEFL